MLLMMTTPEWQQTPAFVVSGAKNVDAQTLNKEFCFVSRPSESHSLSGFAFQSFLSIMIFFTAPPSNQNVPHHVLEPLHEVSD